MPLSFANWSSLSWLVSARPSASDETPSLQAAPSIADRAACCRIWSVPSTLGHLRASHGLPEAAGLKSRPPAAT